MTLTLLVFPLAAVGSLVASAVVLLRGGRGPRELSLAAGMASFAIESLAAYVLLGWVETPEQRRLWLRIVTTCGVLIFVPWGAFILNLLRQAGHGMTTAVRLGVAVGGGVAAVSVALTWIGDPFLVSEAPGRFYAARLDSGLGVYPVIAELLGTVAILAGLELCLRTANREARWRVKYLVLGLGGLFIVRFYLLSHVLLFHVLLAAYLTTQTAALFLATIAIGVSALRAPLASASFVVSRSVVLRSTAVGVLGLYLFIVGALGWLLDRLGLSEELFWGALVVFAGAVVAGALALSEQLRWRLKRFIGVHFYRSKYDYREQWMAFTRRLGSTVALDELAPQLLAATADAVGTAKGILYFGGEDGFQATAAMEVYGAPARLDEVSTLVRRARRSTSPVPLVNGERPSWFPQAAILIPLTWQGSLTGMIILAEERAGNEYSVEDLQFLTAAGIQVAAALVTTRLSETLARSREFEAFHRLTSFVAHDLKNAVSGLSMLSENALKHIDEPDFQRDAVLTVSKTVERMRKLLRRLTSTADVPTLTFEPVDLAALLAGRTATLACPKQVRVTLDLRPAQIVGDPEALERVFQNLVINAVEALDGQGDITVRTVTRDGKVLCQVIDTGCGMSPEFLQRSLFVPFKSSKKGGWGIGLYHAREIVQAHGGQIDVQSEEGRGTTFALTFPAAAAEPRS